MIKITRSANYRTPLLFGDPSPTSKWWFSFWFPLKKTEKGAYFRSQRADASPVTLESASHQLKPSEYRDKPAIPTGAKWILSIRTSKNLKQDLEHHMVFFFLISPFCWFSRQAKLRLGVRAHAEAGAMDAPKAWAHDAVHTAHGTPEPQSERRRLRFLTVCWGQTQKDWKTQFTLLRVIPTFEKCKQITGTPALSQGQMQVSWQAQRFRKVRYRFRGRRREES